MIQYPVYHFHTTMNTQLPSHTQLLYTERGDGGLNP